MFCGIPCHVLRSGKPSNHFDDVLLVIRFNDAAQCVDLHGMIAKGSDNFSHT